jgi:ABC-type oligopeptide transport system substrate-binding subunit
MFMSNNGNNRTGWSNARYDGLVREANAQVDRAKRARLLEQAEILMVREETPIIPLYYYAGLEYYDANSIQGIFPNVLSQNPIRSIYKVSAKPRAANP